MDQKRSPDDNEQIPAPSVPQWRSVAVAPRQPQVVPQAAAMPSKAAPSDEIDIRAYFNSTAPTEEEDKRPKSPWVCANLRPVPAFYPLEKSSRFVDDEKDDVTERLSECLRVLSVQALYNNEAASAYLMTSEGVEMHLSLWKTTGEKSGIVVELQRRKGDSIAFHRYSRYILDAAIGDFDAVQHVRTHGEDIDFVYSKKVQRLLNVELGKSAKASEHENAVIAIEIAHGLLMKDRMDARQLGLESLCLLTDPKKTGITTALIASHVVLLGTARGIEGLSTNTGLEDGIIFDEAPFQGIREAILSLVQFSRIGEDIDFEDEDTETMAALHNLALAVMANALDVIENQERFDENPEETEKKPAAIRTASASDIAGAFMEESGDISKTELLSTLISELGKASQKPHNACLSAKCIGSLCRASDKAKRRAKELGAKNVVSTALEVGTRTHLKLETECNKVTKVLQTRTQEEN